MRFSVSIALGMLCISASLATCEELHEASKRGNELLRGIPEIDPAAPARLTHLELFLNGKSTACETRQLVVEKRDGKSVLQATSTTTSKFDNGVKSVVSMSTSMDMHFRPIEIQVKGTATGQDGRSMSKWEKMILKDGKIHASSNDGEETTEQDIPMPEGDFVSSPEWILQLAKLENVKSFILNEFSIGGIPRAVQFTKENQQDGSFKLVSSYVESGATITSYLFNKNGELTADIRGRTPPIELRVIDKKKYEELLATFTK